jgi:hypothetical protein
MKTSKVKGEDNGLKIVSLKASVKNKKKMILAEKIKIPESVTRELDRLGGVE